MRFQRLSLRLAAGKVLSGSLANCQSPGALCKSWWRSLLLGCRAAFDEVLGIQSFSGRLLLGVFGPRIKTPGRRIHDSHSCGSVTSVDGPFVHATLRSNRH